MIKREKKLMLGIVCSLMVVALSASSLACGSGYSQAEREYVEQELKRLNLLELDVALMNPMI